MTVTNNTADSDGDNEGSGGGIAKVGAGSFSVENSIVAGNSDTPNDAGPGDIHPDCSGEVSSRGYILIGDTAGCTITGDTTNDITGIDPLLGPLADNGGPTKTHALLAGSPALDKADNAICPATDQRGATRPEDGNGDGTAACDVGAFELEARPADTRAPRVISVEPPGGKTGAPRNTNVTVTFSEDVKEATVNESTFKLVKVHRDGSMTRIINVTISCEAATSGGGGGDSCRKATLNPYGTSSTLLAKSTRHKAIVTTMVKDLAGNALDQSPTLAGDQREAWSFITAG